MSAFLNVVIFQRLIHVNDMKRIIFRRVNLNVLKKPHSVFSLKINYISLKNIFSETVWQKLICILYGKKNENFIQK